MRDKFHDMVKDFMEIFMDEFSVFGESFEQCMENSDRVLVRCDETNLILKMLFFSEGRDFIGP